MQSISDTRQNEIQIPDTFLQLEELLDQNQFELTTEVVTDGKLRLVYLMNDAVESFLVFDQVQMTGKYKKEYEGELEASLSFQTDPETKQQVYVLVVRQGDSVCTLFFKNLQLEVNLYNYGKVGHFWVKGYEYLRQLEYRFAILRDKRDYLGEVYCNSTERKLAELTDFPPLNYCCYPAVSEKYIVPKEEPWKPTEKALDVMEDIAERAGDHRLYRVLKWYRKYPCKVMTRFIAGMLHRNVHAPVIDLLLEEMKQAAADYQERSFGETEDRKHEAKILQAENMQKRLKRKGIYSEVLWEEPFVAVKDSVEYKVYLMIWKKGIINRKVEVKEVTGSEI